MKALIIPLLFVGATLFPTARSLAQMESPPSFSVESNEVLVPTSVYDMTLMDLPAHSDRDASSDEVRNLTAKNFHLFQDGKEQVIRSVTSRVSPLFLRVNDNLGPHNEYSDTPRAKWRTQDLPGWGVPPGLQVYVIAYVPPESPLGSCHRIKVEVDRPNSVVFARSEYCNTQHSPSDSLNGTRFGREMEDHAASDKAGKIGLSLQAGLFYAEANNSRVDIALEFPWNVVNRESERSGRVYATIGILGMVYRKDRTLVARFSDLGCCSLDLPTFVRGGLQYPQTPEGQEKANLPTAYETQVDLPPGEYYLAVVLSDGLKFGRIERSLTVESYDRTQLGISSLVLCKRFHAAAAKAELPANFAPEYVPLASNGVEFTPAGDTTLRRGVPLFARRGPREPLFAYFEVYEPLLTKQPETTVQTRRSGD